MRIWRPNSLAGQMALLLGLALLVAQLANFALILNERQKLSLSRDQGPALTNLATVAANYGSADPVFRPALLADNSRRGVRLSARPTSGIAGDERDPDLEDRMRKALADAGAGSPQLVAASAAGADPHPSRRDAQILRIAIRQGDGSWLYARLYTPRGDPWLAARLGAATLLLYLLVLGATAWLAVRIARPLRDLTRAADLFQGRPAPLDVPERGPGDVRRAIRAFNAMSARVSALIGEKDVMLGAIGHDLRTPLASVRIRLEAMEPPGERAAAAATLDEMNRMLDNILMLARSGRPHEQARRMDVASLVDALAEDYRDAGAEVTFTGADRAVAAIHPDLLRQALRNLVDNAIAYGGDAALSVVGTADSVAITVADRGPGLPPDEMRRVVEPFYRVEGSRNRATGGTGLGLAIAKSVAEMHGGTLDLAANVPTGLRATIVVPRSQAPA